jgi:Holliday junction resolvase-like predicted endonuclease
MEAVAAIDCQMLQRVWQELDCRIDVCRITKGGYIEHL